MQMNLRVCVVAWTRADADAHMRLLARRIHPLGMRACLMPASGKESIYLLTVTLALTPHTALPSAQPV